MFYSYRKGNKKVFEELDFSPKIAFDELQVLGGDGVGAILHGARRGKKNRCEVSFMGAIVIKKLFYVIF